ncbi:MAG: winged helix-turn-helix domain-containing protein [Candidatus Omnitrophica bacterium]|nr:winged helix-turn-helix domain-containing protein [Candidatus Omnitrophota bacterium]
MITQIGIVAGEIWHFLDKYGKVDLERLVVGTERPKDIVLMSLGWLAREGHVRVDCSQQGYEICLREKK